MFVVNIEFIETSTFTKYVYQYLTDEEYKNFQIELLINPEKGKVVRDSGGVRKIRWGSKGKGKSGGVRVIYFWKKRDKEIWLITIFSKSEISTIPGSVLKKIAKELQNE